MDDIPLQYQTAVKLLIPLWRGIDPDYKRRYVRSIWDQFENNIKSAAYTSSLSGFYARLSQRLGVTIVPADLPAVTEVLAVTSDDAKRLLRQMRDETATLILFVRLDNEGRKAAYVAREAARKAEDDSPAIYAGQSLFDEESPKS